MSLHAQPFAPIPEATARAARASFRSASLPMQLRDALGSIYHDEDFAALFPKRGRAAQAPWRLALVTVLQAVENLTDRQAADMVRARLDWKYALSLPLEDEGFDASILSDFRARLLSGNVQDLLLEPILRVCAEQGWLKARGQQRTDSTFILAHLRHLNSLEAVGESLRAALNALAEHEPDWLLGVMSPDWFDRYVHRFEQARLPKGKKAQEDLRQQVGEDSWHLMQAAERADAPQRVRQLPLLAVLKQVWQQHYECVAAKAGAEPQVRWRDGPAVSNSQRVLSPYETQARQASKRETTWDGYKVHLSETCEPEAAVHLIVQVQTTVATHNDVETTRPLIEQLAAKERDPARMYVDSGYLSGPLVLEQQQQGRQLVGPIPVATTWQEHTGYGLCAFTLDWQGQQARCPQGQLSTSWKPAVGNRGEASIQVRFARASCQACPVREQCTTAKTSGRTLSLPPRQVWELMQQRRAEQKTPAFVADYARRAGIESTLSEGVRSHGLRHSRYRGQDKTHLHLVAIAAAINLGRLHTMLARQSKGLPAHPPRPLSPLARLHQRVKSA